MKNRNHEIVAAAITAKTVADAVNVQSMIKVAFGSTNYRPLGVIWSNHGLMASSGSSYDLKMIELVTNMQDSVLERLALRKFGSADAVPYQSPHEAAESLLAGLDPQEIDGACKVIFEESDGPASKAKRLTAIFRDHGCGLTPDAIPRTIFRLGGSHKEDALHLQGAFGLGGAMTYRNAGSVVLVTRRDPDLLPEGAPDVISVAVVEWQEMTKGSTAVYLVDQPWDNPGDEAEPWSCPASDFPDFEPGTHLALISYGVEGFHRKTERDDRTFHAVASTRLFRPVMPLIWTNNTDRGRNTKVRGLEDRLETTDIDLRRESDVIPINLEGATYHLPMTLFGFNAAPKEKGGRESLVARQHTVMFTSNGQVHHHWTAEEFRSRTGLNKIYDRVLVVVETDELPIRLRTSLFTADRSAMRRGDAAVKLEETVLGALKGSDALREWNGQLQRESLKGGSNTGMASVARQIGVLIKARGFSFSGASGGIGGRGRDSGASGGSGGSGGRKAIELKKDPTFLSGPKSFKAIRGETRGITLEIDAVNEFFDGRGAVVVTSDHPDINAREITVGKGREGRVKVMIAIPDDADMGEFTMTALVSSWSKASGGLGSDLIHEMRFAVVDDIDGDGAGSGKRKTGSGGKGAEQGSSVALLWSSPEHHEDWGKMTVGEVEMIEAQLLAESPEYSELASLGGSKIPTLTLNEDYPEYKKYLEGRSKKLTDLTRPKEQYAMGVGVALMALHVGLGEGGHVDGERRPLSQEDLAIAQEAAARAVLAVMPAYDVLLSSAGVDGD